MNHPLAAILANKRTAIFIPLLLLTLALMVALNVLGEPLKTEVAPSGIISYELAGTVEEAQAVLDSWDTTAKSYAGFNLGLDYLYLVAYSTAIAFGVVWLAQARQLTGLALRVAWLLAWGQAAAAILDAIENAALFTMLVNGASDPWPIIARWCAMPKFILVIAGLLFVLLGFVYHLVRGRR